MNQILSTPSMPIMTWSSWNKRINHSSIMADYPNRKQEQSIEIQGFYWPRRIPHREVAGKKDEARQAFKASGSSSRSSRRKTKNYHRNVVLSSFKLPTAPPSSPSMATLPSLFELLHDVPALVAETRSSSATSAASSSPITGKPIKNTFIKGGSSLLIPTKLLRKQLQKRRSQSNETTYSLD